MARAFLISAGSSVVSSYSSCLISSWSFFLMCSGIHDPVAGRKWLRPQHLIVLKLHYKGARERGSKAARKPSGSRRRRCLWLRAELGSKETVAEGASVSFRLLVPSLPCSLAPCCRETIAGSE